VLHLHNDFLNAQTKQGREIYDSLQRVVTVSRYIGQQVKTLEPDGTKCLTVNNGIDLAAFSPKQNISGPSRQSLGLKDDDFVMVFSGRITACIVAAGAIALSALERKGITVGTHILECAGVRDLPFSDIDPSAQIEKVKKMDFPVISDVGEAMEAKILAAKAEQDSVGGIIQTAVCGFPAGVGEPWFGSVEGVLSNALFSIGGIKGVEFGAGFSLAGMRGSEANDAFCICDGHVATKTNRSGGINGGISNGMPVLFRCAVKPTPSIALPQDSVDAEGTREEILRLGGRHDPAIVHRARVVVDSVTALVLCDALALRYGTDWLVNGR
jgi:chorismate synthase